MISKSTRKPKKSRKPWACVFWMGKVFLKTKVRRRGR